MTEGEIAPRHIVRGVAMKDIPAMFALCRELGYDPVKKGFGDRVEQVISQPDHAVFVAADDDDSPLGFVHVFARHAIEIEPCAQIQALVVGEAARRAGVGQLLTGAAEQWARAQGYTWMSLYCAASRDAAHDFYESQGFDGSAKVTRFIKQLD